jgi:cell division protein FtsB
MNRSRVIIAVLLPLCAFLGFRAVTISVKRYAAYHDLVAVQGTIAQAQAANERMQSELARMQQSAWLALLARDRLGYAQPSEAVVFVYKSAKSGTISQPQAASDDRSSLRKWWDWLLGNPGPRD